jgi:hypothetical protein
LVVNKECFASAADWVKKAFQNIYKNQLLMVFFNGREILRVIVAELHNVTGRALWQFCQFRRVILSPKLR